MFLLAASLHLFIITPLNGRSYPAVGPFASEFAPKPPPLPNFKKRLLVPQGLTGLAQLIGKYDTSPKNKIRYDLIYIKNKSILLDIKIIVLSVLVSLIGNWQSDSRTWIRKLF